MPPVFGYWPIRGLLNPALMLLEYVGEPYEMEMYGPRGSENDQWPQKKHQLGFPFPNLPYLKDGDTMLTQSEAIIRYLGRKHDLAARTEAEQQQQDVVNGVLADIRAAWWSLMKETTDFERGKQIYRKELVGPVLQQIEKYLENKDFLVGDRLTYVDFILFELLDINSKLFPELLDLLENTNLNKFHHRIAELEGVKQYLTSDRLPSKINGPGRNWGG